MTKNFDNFDEHRDMYNHSVMFYDGNANEWAYILIKKESTRDTIQKWQGRLLMRKFLGIAVTFAMLIAGLSFVKADKALGADNSATISYGSNSTSLNRGLSGYNVQNFIKNYDYSDPAFISNVKALNPGYMRYGGGTSTEVFDWREGRFDPEFNAQFYDEGTFLTTLMRKTEGSEYHTIDAFKKWTDAVGARLVITVNAFTDTPESIGALAKFTVDNNIDVAYWQLANEPYWHNAMESEPKENIEFFKNGTDYAKKMKPFNDAIKAADPNAKTVINYFKEDSSWNNQLDNFWNKYWDAADFHLYAGKASTLSAAMQSANSVLDDELPSIISELTQANPNMDILNTEFNVPADNNPIKRTLYNGIFAAEYMARLSKVPNVKFVGIHQLIEDSLAAATGPNDEIDSAYENGTRFDTYGYNYGNYYRTVGYATMLVNKAINSSDKVMPTTVTGGASVDKQGGLTMPALYAQVYEGMDGKNYTIITNKSANSHDVKIYKGGGSTLVTAAKNVQYISNADPSLDNSPTAPTLIAVQSETAGDTVLVRPYSVTLVSWDNANQSSMAPQTAPRLLSADPQSSSEINLTWDAVPLATGYTINYGTAPGSYSSTYTINSGSTTTHTLTGLSSGTVYYITVSAFNSHGSSGNSNEFPAKTGIPVQPDDVTAISRLGSIKVTWSSSPYARGYKVKVGTSPGTYSYTIDAGNQAGYTLDSLPDGTALTNGTTYYFAVQAYNNVGGSVDSSEASAAPLAETAYAPSNVRVTGTTTNSVTFAWDRTPYEKIFEAFQSPSGAANWTASSGTWNVETRDGSMAYKATGSSTVSISTHNDSSGYHYDTEAIIKFDSWASNGVVGLVARYQDDNNYYKFVYSNSDGKFKIGKKVNGTPYTIANVVHAAPTPGSKLTFKVSYDTLEGYLDDVLVISTTDPDLNHGKMGLYAQNQDVWFDLVYQYLVKAASYNIYRGTSPYSGYSLLTNVSNNTREYTDNTGSSKYYYKLTAIDDSGNESLATSNIVSN
jgi:fibronectin type 3 domain-containing protein